MSAIVRFTASWVSNLAAKLVYSTVEGYAFLFSKYGASVLMGCQAALLLRVAGPGKVFGLGLQAATACIVGRGLWTFFHATQEAQRRAMNDHAESTTLSEKPTAVSAVAAASAAATQSIWDWEPPSGDQLSSGAWHVLRELVVTGTKMQTLYPEISDLMALPELARPEELTSRLYYLYMASQEAGLSDYDLSDAQPVPESAINSLQAMQPLASFAYDCTNDLALSDSLAGRGYRLLLAKYEPDLSSGCPAYYLAISNSSPTEGHRKKRSPLPKITSSADKSEESKNINDDAAAGAAEESKSMNDDGDASGAAAGGDGDGHDEIKVSSNSKDREVVLCIRGTYSPEDIFTDLLMVGVAFGGESESDEEEEEGTAQIKKKAPAVVFNAHAGMAKAALFLVLKFGTLLCSLRDAGVKVTLIGHSLGAGVASILSLHLKQKKYGFTSETLQCFAFEPPACLDLPLAEACSDVVLSTVHADDIVPRMAVGPFSTFLKELSQFDWKAEEKKEGNSLPAPLAVMHKLAGLIGSKSVAESAAEEIEKEEEVLDETDSLEGEDSDQEGSVKKKVKENKYNPFVPGKIVFVCATPEGKLGKMPQEESENTTTGSSSSANTSNAVETVGEGKEESKEKQAAGKQAVRVLLEPSSAVLRRIRLTSSIVSDHFIDKEPFLTALGVTPSS